MWASRRSSPSRASAPTRPRSPAIATLDGDDYVINGEKIFVTSGSARQPRRWATLDRSVGRRHQVPVVPGWTPPGHRRTLGAQARHQGLRHRRVTRVRRTLGSPRSTQEGFWRVRQTSTTSLTGGCRSGRRRRPARPWKRDAPPHRRGRPRDRLMTACRRAARCRRGSSSAWSRTVPDGCHAARGMDDGQTASRTLSRACDVEGRRSSAPSPTSPTRLR